MQTGIAAVSTTIVKQQHKGSLLSDVLDAGSEVLEIDGD